MFNVDGEAVETQAAPDVSVFYVVCFVFVAKNAAITKQK